MFWAIVYTVVAITTIVALFGTMISYAKWCYDRESADFLDFVMYGIVGASVLTFQAFFATSILVVWMAWAWHMCFTLAC